jgi:hypothetical protein
MADQPIINPNWLTHPTDQVVAVAAYKRVREMWATSVMQEGVVLGPEYFPGLNVSSDAEILTLIRESFNTVSHASSTCKMGQKTDPFAVVDRKARVYGVSNLRVVDASILPFLPPGMPIATICMCLPLLQFQRGPHSGKPLTEYRRSCREDRGRHSSRSVGLPQKTHVIHFTTTLAFPPSHFV